MAPLSKNTKTWIWVIIGIIVFALMILFSYHYKYTQVATKSEFRNLLENHHLKYLENLHEKDLYHRGIPTNVSTNQLFKIYLAKYREKGMFSHLILENVVSRLRRISFINNRKIPWKFAIVTNSMEGGNPFTIHDTIVISSKILGELYSVWFKNDDQFIESNVINTLIHERIHILQKRYSYEFDKLYIKHWGFYHDVVDVPKTIRSIIRTNPDGMDLSWTWSGGIRVFCVFKPFGPAKINNVEIIYANNDNRLGYVKFLPNFMKFFGFNVNYYHPHEISAEIIAQLITKNNPALLQYPAAIQCKEWLKGFLNNGG